MEEDRGFKHSLSCYLSVPGELAVLARHDHGVALWRHGGQRVELVRLWEVERISGQKHHTWPLFTPARAHAFLNDLLAGEGLTLDDIDAIWGTPGLPRSTTIQIPDGAEEFPVHSLSHLFSGLLLDTEIFRTELILGMAVDGAPDRILDERSPRFWYVGCLSRQGDLTFVPIESPGPLYTAASTLFGLEPGSLMALTSACRTTIRFDTDSAVSTLRLAGGRLTPWTDAFGLVRSLISEAEQQLTNRNTDSGFTPAENVQSAVMKHVQRACDLVAIRNVENLRSLGEVDTEDAYLAMGGGFALNCPTNTLLLDRFKFRGLLASPCANDSGQALGLGLLGLYGAGALDNADFRFESPYHGSPLRDVDEALNEFAPWIADVTAFSPHKFVEDVSDNVLAWVDGAAEIGPRALGHRSLLGDARSAKVKDLLNGHKRRQWWRPVAPIVLEERAGEWFERARPSPYMLEAVQVRPEVAERVPAILHLDGSARHQTLTASANSLLHSAIDAFREETGVPILCNTSLNDKGEPIVNTAAEALTFCINKGIAIAYLGGRRVALRDEPVPAVSTPSGPRARAVDYFAGQETERDLIWQSWLERGFSTAAIFLLSWSPISHLSRTTSASPEMVNKLAEYYLSNDENFESLVTGFLSDRGPGSFFVRAPGGLPRPVIVT